MTWHCAPPHARRRQTHALIMALSKKGCFTVDELRRGIEALPAEAYATLSYYEKWARSAASALTDRGVLTLAEVEAALGEEEEAEPAIRRAHLRRGSRMPCQWGGRRPQQRAMLH